MEALRESWTDDRLDDLRAEMRDGFKGVDERFDRVDRDVGRVRAELRAEMYHGFSRADAEFRQLRSEMKAGFDRVDDKFESLQRTLIWFSGSLVVSLISLLGAFMLTQA